jgi:hypothetical protein
MQGRGMVPGQSLRADEQLGKRLLIKRRLVSFAQFGSSDFARLMLVES